MSASVAAPAAPAFGTGSTRRRRALLWGALVALLAVAQSMLVWLTVDYERSRAQEHVELVAAAVSSDLRQALSRDLQSLQALLWNEPTPSQWRADASDLLRSRREILRIERRDTEHRIIEAVESPYQSGLFTRIKREEIDVDTEVACSTAVRHATPVFSRSYFVPMPGRHTSVTSRPRPPGMGTK
jgi:two-component system sensor histidine kinase DctS